MGFGRQHQAMQRDREGFCEAIELIEGNLEPASFECGNRVDGPPELFGKAGSTPATSNAQAFAVAEGGKKHGDKQVVTAEFIAGFVGFAGINVMLEGAVHGGLDKGVDAGYCVHGLQLLFFELLYGVLPRETGACNPFLWASGFIPDSSATGEGAVLRQIQITAVISHMDNYETIAIFAANAFPPPVGEG